MHQHFREKSNKKTWALSSDDGSSGVFFKKTWTWCTCAAEEQQRLLLTLWHLLTIKTKPVKAAGHKMNTVG